MYFAVIREQGSRWDSSQPMRERALLIVAGDSEDEVAARLDDDPWTTFGVLETVSIDRWDVLVGEFAPG